MMVIAPTARSPPYLERLEVKLMERILLSLIHLRNMTALTEAGAVILPACPSFYAGAQDVEALCGTVADRAVALLGVDAEHYEWGE